MNVYKPLMIFDVIHSIILMSDGCVNFRKFLVEGTKPNLKKINEYVERSLMLVTALSPVIGYDKASKIAHHAMDNDLTLKEAACNWASSPRRNSIASSIRKKWSSPTWRVKHRPRRRIEHLACPGSIFSP